MIDLDYYTYCRSHRPDARIAMAQKYRDEAEKAEAERLLNQTFKDLDDTLCLFKEDPIEDYSDSTEAK